MSNQLFTSEIPRGMDVIVTNGSILMPQGIPTSVLGGQFSHFLVELTELSMEDGGDYMCVLEMLTWGFY